MSLLSDIKRFNSSTLKPVESRVTRADGRVFTERRRRTITHHSTQNMPKTSDSVDVSEFLKSECDETSNLGFVADMSLDLECAEIIPGLFISSQDVAADLVTLTRVGITHILNLVTPSAVPNYFPAQFTYCNVSILDLPETDLIALLPRCLAFIHATRREGRHADDEGNSNAVPDGSGNIVPKGSGTIVPKIRKTVHKHCKSEPEYSKPEAMDDISVQPGRKYLPPDKSVLTREGMDRILENISHIVPQNKCFLPEDSVLTPEDTDPTPVDNNFEHEDSDRKLEECELIEEDDDLLGDDCDEAVVADSDIIGEDSVWRPDEGGGGCSSSSSGSDSACLVHCNAGRSRAVAVVVAYLMWRQPRSLTFSQALRLVQSKRTGARPNAGFMKQLEEWDPAGRLIQLQTRITPGISTCSSST